MTIYLGFALPQSSSDYGEHDGQPFSLCTLVQGALPFQSCSGWGLQGRGASPHRRWALAPPFHPYLENKAVYFCCTFLKVAFTGRYPAPLSCGARTFLISISLTRSLGLLDIQLSKSSLLRAKDPSAVLALEHLRARRELLYRGHRQAHAAARTAVVMNCRDRVSVLLFYRFIPPEDVGRKL